MANVKFSEIHVEGITALVHGFYGDIQADAQLGPIFDVVVGQSEGGWPPHLEKMVAFWSAVLLGIPGYSGNPRIAHMHVPSIEVAHFARWLFMFRLSCHRIFEPDAANVIMARAEQMGIHLSSVVRDRDRLGMS